MTAVSAPSPVVTPMPEETPTLPADPTLERMTAKQERMPLWGLLALLGVTALGGLLRFWRLDRPHKLVFDETYYVKQGWSMFKAGYELKWSGTGDQVDPKWNAGTIDVFTREPDFVVHPPVGKWMIGFGEWLFGPTSSWGWRFSAAVVGTLSILMLGLIARRLFDSTLLGIVAALLLAVDGMHFVQSRTSLLDVFVMFWALAAFGCLVQDRDQGRRQLARAVMRRRERGGPVGYLGPGIGVRWWRLAAAVCLGLCAGTKWSGLYFAIAFGLLALGWDLSARRQAGIRGWFLGAPLRDGLLAGVTMVPVVVGVYLASWTGWFRSTDAWDRQWGAEHPSASSGWIPDAIRSLWHYHRQMWDFNINLASDHPYKANPWSWIVMGRPTAFFYEDPKRGTAGCRVEQCSQAITALGNPVIWWGGTLAVLVLLFAWLLRRDWRAGAVLAGLAGGYLPWFMYQHRTIYNFYSIAFTPWMVLAVTFCLGLLLGPPVTRDVFRRSRALRGRAIAASGFVVLAVLVFWFFLPIYDAQVIPQQSWSDRMWLQSWI
jgi:dolichyl-phosphate-mannose-protein mannosyltransferase